MTFEEEKYFNPDRCLYHYTSMRSAFKILESMTLRFSNLNKMNDINESFKYIYYEQGVSYERIEQALNQFKQISLTMNSNECKGYYIPAMWSHYAENGEGVCLVIDKDKFLRKLPRSIKHNNVIYSEEFDNNLEIKDKDVLNFMKEHSKELFFTKSLDWCYEHEYRLFSWSRQVAIKTFLLKDVLKQ